MSQGWRRWLTPQVKELILRSIPYRLYLRSQIGQKKIRFSVEVTTKCNVNCVMCTRLEMIQKKRLEIGEIDGKVIEVILKEIEKFTDNGWEVTLAPMGLGEPLMYSKLTDFLLKAKKISTKVRVVLVSNGVLFDDRAAKDLIKAGVDEISISLNVNSTKNYQKYIRANNYEKVKKNIERLINIRNKIGSEKTAIFIQYLDYDNKPQTFGEDIKKWQRIMTNKDKCYVHPIVNQAGFKKDGITIKEIESFPCSSPLERVAIRINGDIYPCDPCYYAGNSRVPELFLGNVLRKSVYKMFNDKNSRNYKINEMMKADDYSKLPTCAKCNTYKLGANNYFKILGKWR